MASTLILLSGEKRERSLGCEGDLAGQVDTGNGVLVLNHIGVHRDILRSKTFSASAAQPARGTAEVTPHFPQSNLLHDLC